MNKLKSIVLGLMTISVFTIFLSSCEKYDIEPNKGVITEKVILSDEVYTVNTRIKSLPPCCGGQMTNISSENFCNLNYGFIWSNGKCWACP